MLTGKHPEDVNWLGKPERDFSGDERDKKKRDVDKPEYSLWFCSTTFTFGCSMSAGLRRHLFFKVIPLPLDSLTIYMHMYILKHVFFHLITIY